MSECRLIRVRTPSRLHFGLLRLPSTEGPGRWPDGTGRETIPARHFGGVGLMVSEPGIELTVRPAADWSATGPLAERALLDARAFERNAALRMRTHVSPHEVRVERAAPEHRGLGTGTQLALAVARALAVAANLETLDVLALAALVGRGARSALGIHGFAQGGFLVEGGKGPATAIAPLVARLAFPQTWRIVLVLPPGPPGLHGLGESHVFATLGQQPDLGDTDALCRLVLLGMLPALEEHDLSGFGEALYDFNRRVGELFRPWQGGVYAHPQAEAIVNYLRREGVRGVGQSSWGPALFAISAADQADRFAQQLRRHFNFAPDDILVTAANNRGA